MNQHVNI